MEKKFLKQIEIKEMVIYLLQKWWIILLGCILFGIVAALGGMRTQEAPKQEQEYVLEDGNYVYTTLLNIKVKDEEIDTVGGKTYLGLIISNSSITAAIEELQLSENFIDIFNKMSWEVEGANIKLKISSPVQSVDGYSWEEVLSVISKKGEEIIKSNYSQVEDVRVIDEPYLENAIADMPQVEAGSSINIKRVILAAMIGGVVVSACLLVVFLLRKDIRYKEEIERNLGIPVLATINQKKINTGR